MYSILKKLQNNNHGDSLGSEFIPLTSKNPPGSITDTDISTKTKGVPTAKTLQCSWVGLSFDIVLVAVPLIFLGLLIAAASQDRKVESIIGDRVRDALLLSPTIFPIVFAAICGKAMKSIALYKSQSGMSLRQSLKEPLAINSAGGGTFPNGTTSIVFPQPYPSTGYATAFLYATKRSMSQFAYDTTQPLEIFYGSRTWGEGMEAPENGGLLVSLATCTLLPRGLETFLDCTGEVCHASSARRIPVPVEIVLSITSIIRRGHFCGVGSSYHINEASQTDHFLADGFVGDDVYEFRNLYQLPLAQFTERFQQVINTFWYASNTLAFSTGNFSSSSVREHVLQTPALVTEDLGLHYL
ncbi:hypothetical protein CcaCcLH18_11108 [Colletotrichum camelliae]|nr:hypothetical protein CcaCcLH18_11108 [Colletotrichum camelliae]